MSDQVQTNGSNEQIESINDFQISVNGEQIPLSKLVESEAARSLIIAAFQQEAAESKKAIFAANQSAADEVRRFQNELANLKEQHEEMQGKFNHLQVEEVNQRKQVMELQFQLDDMTSKRDAAVSELEEAKAELEQVKSHRDDLQKQIAVGVRGAIQVDAVQALEAWKKEKEAEQASKPAIYDVHALDQRKSKYGASLLNGDYIEIPYLELGKYRELKPEEVEAEVARFRTEQAPQTAETADNVGTADDHADSALVTPPPLDGESFQGDEVAHMDNGSGLVETVAGVEASGETFEEEVKRRLHELEITVFGAGWANK